MKNTNTDQVKGYFTEEVRTRIREMSNQDMKDHLKSLESTPAFIAILKYFQDRTGVVQDSFLTLDPVKEPSKISQYQGIITGFWDLPDAVINLKFDSKKKENPKHKEEEAINDLGGAYGKY